MPAALSPWALATLYGAVAILLGVLVRTVLRRTLVQVAQHHKTALNEVVAASLPRPAGIATFLLTIGAAMRWMQLPDAISDRVRRLLPFLFAVLAVAVLMRVALRAIEAYGRENPELRSSAGIGRAVTWVGGLAAIALFVCDAFGVSLAPAITALGVGSLAVGLGLQDTLSNFFAGLYLLADKPVSPGDFIKVETYEGYVEAIGWRSTQLRTLANNLVVVPNASLSKAIITNFNRPEPKVATELRVDVAQDADLDKVEDLLADEAARAHDVPAMMSDPAPVVRLAPGFVDGAIAFTIFFHVKSVTEQGLVQHELRRRILRRLKSEKIPLPPPRPRP